MGELRLFLLGGAAASGKTHSGLLLARRLGLSCVSGDSLWHALQAVTTRESDPPFHYFEPTKRNGDAAPTSSAGATSKALKR